MFVNRFLTNSLKIFLLFVVIGFAGCIPQKKMTYFKETSLIVDTVASNLSDEVYKIKPKDELYISIQSMDPETYSFFTGGVDNNSNFTSEAAIYLNSYTVNDSGKVALPVLGEISIKGLTLLEATTKIETELKKYLNEVIVIIKLSGFRVTLLGEVDRPGRYITFVSNLNIMEALALAGDMTAYGNREDVTIIREVNGKEQIIKVNLLDRSILNSPNFNLLPNDIIYVPALNAKTWGFESFPYQIIISSVTTFIALTTLILSATKK